MTARYGGEEFACVLPGADPETALATAHEIQFQIQSLNIPHQSSEVSTNVTVSMGIASARTHPGMSGSLWLQQADHQLYASKKSGRNQIARTEFSAA
ncbi:Phytochrome-like protein cph2 [compost metagenome]